jgi:hypothetical protein
VLFVVVEKITVKLKSLSGSRDQSVEERASEN